METVLKKIVVVSAFVLGAVLGGQAHAVQTYPSRPITVIMGFGPGSATDRVMRLVTAEMSNALNVPVVVENKPGANQAVAISLLMSSKPDGYTLYVGTGSTLAQNVAVNPDLPYKPLRDFSFVATVGLHPGVLVASPTLPVSNLKGLIEHLRAHPGKLNFVSAGIGSSNQLAMLYLMGLTDTSMVEIPMKTDVQISMELMANRGDVAFQTAQTVEPFVTDGKLRAIAVARKQRLPYLPNTPTFAEAGLPEMEGIDPYAWAGLVGPAGMPDEIVKKLNAVVSKIVSSPEITGKLRNNMRMEPMVESPEGFRKYVENEIAKWSAMSAKLNLKTN